MFYYHRVFLTLSVMRDGLFYVVLILWKCLSKPVHGFFVLKQPLKGRGNSGRITDILSLRGTCRVGVDSVWTTSLGAVMVMGADTGDADDSTSTPSQNPESDSSSLSDFDDEPLDDNPNSGDKYTEFGMIDESLLEKSIETAVRQMIDEGLGKDKSQEPTPVEKFQSLYLELKTRDRKQTTLKGTNLDAAAMLEKLLGGEQAKDPFDERKVMIKLRNVLTPEDFYDLFKDPTIGDWL